MTEEERKQIMADFEREIRFYKIGQAALLIGIAFFFGVLLALLLT